MSMCTMQTVQAFLREKMKTYRRENALTQEAFAEKLDISVRYCSSLENGKNGISLNILYSFLRLLPEEERMDVLYVIADMKGDY